MTHDLCADYTDTPLEKPLKLVLKVGGSEVTELSGSGHDSSYYDDRSDHERERHKEKKKKKKKKSEKEKHLDEEERRKRKVKVQWPVMGTLVMPGPVLQSECILCRNGRGAQGLEYQSKRARAVLWPLFFATHRKRKSGSGRRSTATQRGRLMPSTLERRWRWSHPRIDQ